MRSDSHLHLFFDVYFSNWYLSAFNRIFFHFIWHLNDRIEFSILWMTSNRIGRLYGQHYTQIMELFSYYITKVNRILMVFRLSSRLINKSVGNYCLLNVKTFLFPNFKIEIKCVDICSYLFLYHMLLYISNDSSPITMNHYFYSVLSLPFLLI